MKRSVIIYGFGVCLFYAACTFPHLFSFQLGLENISDDLIQRHALTTKRVGLVANQTSCNQAGMSSVQVLRQKGIHVVAICAPEHGYYGTIPAGSAVQEDVESTTGIPIISLYRVLNGTVGQMNDQAILHNIDTLVFDLQDCGMRHYTYISTLLRCLETVAAHKKQLLVLDRPNLLGPLMEGPLVERDLISFIAIAPIPLRYGMTIGELALYFNTYIIPHAAHVEVVPMEGYSRQRVTAQLVAPLSPNIRTLHACYGYSFLGLLGEVHPFNVGISTPNAFQCIMLPRSCAVSPLFWDAVKKMLQEYNIHGASCSVFHEHKKEYYDGIKITIDTIETISSFAIFMRLLTLARDYGIDISFSSTFDKAIGTHSVRTFFEQGASLTSLVEEYKKQLDPFYKKASSVLLYTPRLRLQ